MACHTILDGSMTGDRTEPGEVVAEVTQLFDWSWNGQSVPVRYDVRGQGPEIFLLPAMSTVSTRHEMGPLSRLLAPRFRTICPDWPGFADAPRPRLRYEPALYRQFLRDFTSHVVGHGVVVAAGHAAPYALELAHSSPSPWSHIVLVAPTWRGPLPTMMGGYRPLQARLRRLIELPVIGEALYRLNTLPSVIAFMYRRHVYADPRHLTPTVLEAKVTVAHQRGARFASAAFVTGALDLVRSREHFHALADPKVPILLLYGAQTPARSRTELEALAALPSVESRCFEHGSLGLHEEFAEPVAEAVQEFLARRASGSA